jgi:hypothetical protein
MGDFDRDALSIPTPPAVGAQDNKFEVPVVIQADGSLKKDVTDDGVPSIGSPGLSSTAEVNLTLAPNQFPRELGHDSLTDDPIPLS